ncbi:nucleoside deaminase [Planctomonas psychrotolerans]|uniref:nucleoside deaminase n=1 Tax=Planctomonas psychrotolerans TaxID=2528712 RepID=UPI00123BB89F|nr:nucleoside deaminase [Planctomonas psychrotolerans]
MTGAPGPDATPATGAALPIDDEGWLAMAVDLAVANVAAGGGPFGAVIARQGELVATGQNRVTRDNDPTAHGEVVAIRAACNALGSFSLAGCVLYTSCEPCPLCVSASLWARLDRVVYSADRHDAARGGFDDREFYELFARDRATWPLQVQSLRTATAATPFDAWLAAGNRIDY